MYSVYQNATYFFLKIYSLINEIMGAVESRIPGHLSVNWATMFPTIAALLQEYKLIHKVAQVNYLEYLLLCILVTRPQWLETWGPNLWTGGQESLTRRYTI